MTLCYSAWNSFKLYIRHLDAKKKEALQYIILFFTTVIEKNMHHFKWWGKYSWNFNYCHWHLWLRQNWIWILFPTPSERSTKIILMRWHLQIMLQTYKLFIQSVWVKSFCGSINRMLMCHFPDTTNGNELKLFFT